VEHAQNYLEPGAEIANYRVQSLIARGGMGVVYRALDMQLSRPVALKLLAPELAANEKFRQRFVRESRLAASVDHPNILPIYGAGEWSGLLYIAMRYVRGTDVKAELDRRGALPLPEALRILTDTAAALDAAHAAGLVHRDVKPGNILLSDDRVDGHRHVYLTDFGLTKRATSATGVTTAGHFLGTLDYVAPEQIRGEDVDSMADVYALACVAYTLFSGHPPFDHEEDSAQLWAHMFEEPPRLSQERPEVPAAVTFGLLRGMAKERENRPASCGALIAMMSDGASPGATPKWPRDSGTVTKPAGNAPDNFGGGDVDATTGQPAVAVQTPEPGSRPKLGENPQHRKAPQARGRTRWVVLLSTVVFLVVGAALLLSWLMSADERVTFRADGIPYTLDVPASWIARTREAGDSTVSVLSGADLTALFADEPGAPADAARTLSDDPASVVGLAIYHRPAGLSDASAATRLDVAEALLPGQDASLVDRGATTVGDVKGQVMEGTMPLTATTTLQVRVLVVETEPIQLWVFFAPSSLFHERTGVFDEVAGSLRQIN
jgi:serine/threonine protein kinase